MTGLEQSNDLAVLVVLGDRLAAAASLDDVIDVALVGVEELLGHDHAILLVHEPDPDRLVTLASRGYPAGGVGSEVELEQGVIGMAGARRRPMRIGNLQRMLSYAQAAHEPEPGAAPPEIRLPGLADARSQLAAPMVAGNVLVGVLAVESSTAIAYDERHEQLLTIAAQLVAAALEREQDGGGEGAGSVDDQAPTTSAGGPGPAIPVAPVVLRHYAVDGSTFLDDDYVIKGVAGRLLWKLAAEHVATGRTAFTNREAKLDPILELPPYRDNFESRLILLKRRLDDRGTPLRLRSTGRGRFELDVRAPLDLDHVDRP
ncbi:hypothetical protein BH10ACT1_BH10ACT1_05620 [soil metagenome]